ncbi:biotin-dependent carboxyltransferase family protein [Nocardioides panacisoli]|uniref:5-oxoprolinase subunit C family protein n=1 Tax=Nocardioides panacisoli TaxID=627624 RepID=UPI001C63376E|nr:biotin-dependent carboxyltransferase family protein [Nocardioides panacisoli]QYJ05098.1 biotin-dependent carboxyltransferase family protein [Nocardioides panacisoli]
MRRGIEVLETGALATVQDRGRPGHASLGVGHSGVADRGALGLANRLLGNDPGAAAVEVTFGGLRVRAHGDLVVALTGAPCPARVDGRGIGCNAPTTVPDGAELVLDAPTSGLRTYLAVRGGIDVAPVLGSRSTDVLAGLGPPVLAADQHLGVGTPAAPLPDVDQAPVAAPAEGDVELRVAPGPRADWFVEDALASLCAEPYEVTADSNRVGIRLAGPELRRRDDAELPSEGMALGALQVPPSGQPTLFLADHPVTGGYPVIGVVVDGDVDRAAQARPGQRIRFRTVPGWET